MCVCFFVGGRLVLFLDFEDVYGDVGDLEKCVEVCGNCIGVFLR